MKPIADELLEGSVKRLAQHKTRNYLAELSAKLEQIRPGPDWENPLGDYPDFNEAKAVLEGYALRHFEMVAFREVRGRLVKFLTDGVVE
jgi:hypothetical protein